jgi:hypothetical protein
MFVEDPARELRKFLEANPQASSEAEVTKKLESLANYVKILGLQYEALYQGLELLELRNEATRLQVRLIEQYVKIQKQPLIEAMRTASEAEATKLLEKAKKLDSLLQRR